MQPETGDSGNELEGAATGGSGRGLSFCAWVLYSPCLGTIT